MNFVNYILRSLNNAAAGCTLTPLIKWNSRRNRSRDINNVLATTYFCKKPICAVAVLYTWGVFLTELNLEAFMGTPNPAWVQSEGLHQQKCFGAPGEHVNPAGWCGFEIASIRKAGPLWYQWLIIQIKKKWEKFIIRRNSRSQFCTDVLIYIL